MRTKAIHMPRFSLRSFCFWCLATVAFISALRAGGRVVPSSRWPEAAQLMLLGAGLSYVGSHFAKHKA